MAHQYTPTERARLSAISDQMMERLRNQEPGRTQADLERAAQIMNWWRKEINRLKKPGTEALYNALVLSGECLAVVHDMLLAEREGGQDAQD